MSESYQYEEKSETREWKRFVSSVYRTFAHSNSKSSLVRNRVAPLNWVGARESFSRFSFSLSVQSNPTSRIHQIGSAPLWNPHLQSQSLGLSASFINSDSLFINHVAIIGNRQRKSNLQWWMLLHRFGKFKNSLADVSIRWEEMRETRWRISSSLRLKLMLSLYRYAGLAVILDENTRTEVRLRKVKEKKKIFPRLRGPSRKESTKWLWFLCVSEAGRKIESKKSARKTHEIYFSSISLY